MKKTILIFLMLFAISFCYSAVAERTKEICEDLKLGNGTYYFPIKDTFKNSAEVQAIFLKNLNFTKFNEVNHPLDFYFVECSGAPLTCYYPQLGIEITSGQGITINCSHEGPTHEEAKKIWIDKYQHEKKKQSSYLILGSITLLSIVIATIIFSIKFFGKSEYEKKIEKWIKYYKNKGYNLEYLKSVLISQGHSKEIINKIIKRMK